MGANGVSESAGSLRPVLRVGDIVACMAFLLASAVVLEGDGARSMRGEEGFVFLLGLLALWSVALVSSLMTRDFLFRGVTYVSTVLIGSVLFRRASISAFQDSMSQASIWSIDFATKCAVIMLATLAVVLVGHGMSAATRRLVGALRGA